MRGATRGQFTSADFQTVAKVVHAAPNVRVFPLLVYSWSHLPLLVTCNRNPVHLEHLANGVGRRRAGLAVEASAALGITFPSRAKEVFAALRCDRSGGGMTALLTIS